MYHPIKASDWDPRVIFSSKLNGPKLAPRLKLIIGEGSKAKSEVDQEQTGAGRERKGAGREQKGAGRSREEQEGAGQSRD